MSRSPGRFVAFTLGLCAAVALSAPSAYAQFNTPTVNCDIGTDEYGTGNVNSYGSGTPTWYMTWDDTYLYVSIQNANETEAGILYLDWDPILPVNGGSSTAGNLTGLPGYDGLTPDLPFRADAVLYFYNGYRELRRRDGAGGWTSISSGGGGLGGGSNDYAEGHYCSNGRGNGDPSDDDRELRIAWSRLTGGGSRPAAFNWNGYLAYSNGIYGQVPAENPSGTLGFGATPDMIRYFTVTGTTNGTSTNPVSQNSYTHIGGSIPSYGGVSVYDFTLNTTGATITRGSGDWTIGRHLVVSAGTLSFGTSGTTSVQNVHVTGGTLDLGATPNPLQASGSVTVDGTLALSTAVGGDLKVDGDVTLNGTFNANDRAIFFEGTSAQTLGGSLAPVNLPFLILDNAAGLTLETTVNLTGTLALTSGTLAQGAGSLVLASRIAPLRVPTITNGNSNPATSGASGSIGSAFEADRYFALVQDGWRLFSSPVAGAVYSSLNNQTQGNGYGFHTQGAPWATNTNGAPILYRFDETSQDFVGVTGLDAPFVPGEGYLFYAFKDYYPGPLPGALPTRWRVTGSENAEITTPLVVGATLADSYNFVGNPHLGDLDWNTVVANSSNLGTTYQVWDPSVTSGGGTSGYKLWNSSTNSGAAGRYIAPFQGFFVQPASVTAASIRFDYDMKANNETPIYFGRSSEAPAPHVRLDLSGNGLGEYETYAVFFEQGQEGEDPGDTYRLASLNEDYATLIFEDGTGRPLAMDARPLDAPSHRFALRFETTRAGTYTLAWPDLTLIPTGWALVLTDLVKGTSVDIRQTPSYTFEAGAMAPRRAEGGPPAGGAAHAHSDIRFVLEVEAAPVTVAAQPVDGPITIGPDGGRFQYTVVLTNRTAQPQTVETWSAVEGAIGREPVLGPREVTLPAGATVTKTLTQQVPAAAPAGTYTYHVRLGAFPNGVSADDRFTVLKEGGTRRAHMADEGWMVAGWEEPPTAAATVPGAYVLSAIAPNPIRGSAHFSLRLAERQTVTVALYDVLGRKIALLHDGVLEAEERHGFTLDASDLAAGVYVLRVDGAEIRASQTITFMR